MVWFAAMCGFAGFVDFRNQSSPQMLKSMSDSLVHRGPDDSGLEFFQTSTAQVGLGFRRLSIIELSELGRQPMHYPDAGLVIVFNGEIYNFREIRKQLEVEGFGFVSDSDTEVILKSYAKWGVKCVEHFVGMFAIAIYDSRKQKVVLFRDRAGVKPLYFFYADGLFLFGSELKAFHRHPRFQKKISEGALSQFFQRGYISAPHSIFENTFKLLQGHSLTICLETQKIQSEKYWDVVDCYNQPRLNIGYDEAKANMKSLMLSAFQYRMVADVPVGVFLSGGYDSTAVTALLQSESAQRLKTFTIGFEDPKFNEAQHARKVAEHLGTDHHEYICTYQDALDMVEHLPQIYDEPFGDTSAIPTTLVSRMARKQVTVALSADGGDEVFAGYPKYFNALKRIQQLGRVPRFVQVLLKSLIPENLQPDIAYQNKWSKLLDYFEHTDEVKRFDIISQACTFFETKKLLKHEPKFLSDFFDDGRKLNGNNSLLSKLIATEYKTYLPDDILHKVDRATMSVSLEGREPFLDQRIIAFAAQLPDHFKYRNGVGKRMLKEIVHDYVPRTLMERPKMGFGVPLETWLRKELKHVFTDVVNEDKLKRQGVFNTSAAMRIRDAYLASERVDFQRVSYLFLFQLWHEKWME